MQELTVKSFTVENQTGGMGIDTHTPAFSWKTESAKKNTVQRAYRLRVTGGNRAYDSGEVISEQSAWVVYEGAPLLPQTEYTATVEITSNHGDTACAELTFETGTFGKFDADFIAASAEKLGCFEVFTTFPLQRKVKKARLYATALGMYVPHINGARAGDTYFAPGWTSYHRTLMYQTYDVSDMLLRGENEISLTVAKGWYSGALAWREENHNHYGGTNAALAEVHVWYEDGGKEIVKTDGSWRSRRSYISDSEIYNGETQDFTQDVQETFGVKTVGYDKSVFTAQASEPCRVTERVKPVRKIITPKGEQVFDFGQNLVGVVEMKTVGKRGQKVIFRHAEILDKEGNFYTENLRAALSTDTFILRGGEQTVSAVFTWHGFRYLQVSGTDASPDDFTALVIHSDMPSVGKLETSDPLINRLICNIRWGQRGNFVDIPTDCPQRDERLGWTGDINAFCGTAAFNYDVYLFLRKWLRSLRDDQNENGMIPVVIPDVLIGDWPPGTEAMWSSVAIMLPWKLYGVYGDARILNEQYDSMRKYIEALLSTRGEKGLIDSGVQYGDWLSLDGAWNGEAIRGGTDHYFIANIFCIECLRILSEAAALLEKSGDGEKYAAEHDTMLDLFRKEYFTEGGRMVSETETACALALYFDIVPPSLRAQIVQLFRSVTQRHKGKLVTGFTGTPFLCFALTDNGLHEFSEKMIRNEEYPGWLYSVKMGATTVWERWNSLLEDGSPNPEGMNSFNHYAYGAVGEYLWRRVAGIDSLAPGFKKIKIRPCLIEGIDAVAAEFESVYGTIGVRYERKGKSLILRVKIPVNTTAEVYLPNRKLPFAVGSGEYEFPMENMY